jgi:hypothetical protein
MTLTTCCSSSGVLQLWPTRDQAGAAGVELRLLIPPDQPFQRIVGPTGPDREVAIYQAVDRPAGEHTASSIPGPDAVFAALL